MLCHGDMRPDRYDVRRGETMMKQKKAGRARAVGWMWMGQENRLLWEWEMPPMSSTCRSWSCSTNSMEPHGYPPAEDVMQWLQPWRSTHDSKSSTTHHPLFVRAPQLLFCGSVDKWSGACNAPANSSELLYRWQQGLGPLRMSCECMGMLQRKMVTSNNILPNGWTLPCKHIGWKGCMVLRKK